MTDPAVRAKAVRRYVDGDRLGDIVREAGVTTRSVLNWLKAAGVPTRGNTHNPATPAVRAEAVRRYAGGDRLSDIAADAGVSERAVLNWIEEAGLPKRGNTRRPDIPPGLVRWLRDSAGCTWSEVVEVTGMARFAAERRYQAELDKGVPAAAVPHVAAWLAKTHPDGVRIMKLATALGDAQ